MSAMGTEGFWAYSRERYRAFLRKERGEAKPWTEDIVLQQYRFCNIFREDDKVTRWFKKHVRDPLSHDRSIVFACVMFRFFNRIETGERLLAAGLFDDWSSSKARFELTGVSPLVTGAYMVKTPLRKPKLEGLIEIMEPLWADRDLLFTELDGGTLERAVEVLTAYPWVGPFMAYEAVTDLRHTPVLRRASDRLTWANPGPGAARGLSRLIGQDPDHFHRSSRKDVTAMLELMRQLLDQSRSQGYWPQNWPSWEMREVEHTLCEYDKYRRVIEGQGTPKQRYNGCPSC